jgi:uncharacterized membrane protein YccF (DUF307 family)
MIMRNEEKNIETKKLPRLGINMKFWFRLAGLAVVFGLIHAFGASISTVIGIYLGYNHPIISLFACLPMRITGRTSVCPAG